MPFAVKTQAPSAGFPPVELFIVVQLLVAPLKFSTIIGKLAIVPPVAVKVETVLIQPDTASTTTGVGTTFTVIVTSIVAVQTPSVPVTV